MFRRILKKTIASYAEKIVRYVNQIAPNFDPETIHSMRTETKKILSLTQLSGKKKCRPIKLAPGFKKLYGISGGLRDVYNLQERLKKENIAYDPNLDQWLRIQTIRMKRKWLKNNHKQEIEKSFKNSKNILSKSSSGKCISRVLGKHLKRVDRTIHGKKLNDERLHLLRKELKQMQYIAEWCQNKYKDGAQVLEQYSLEELKKLSGLAGDYNDLRIAIEYLNQYFLEKRNGPENLNHTLQQHWEREKTKIKRTLTDQIINYYNSIDNRSVST